MIWRTTFEQERSLLAQPETGMGYQLVQFRPGPNEPLRRAIAYNAQLLIDRNEEFAKHLETLRLWGFRPILENAFITQHMTHVVDLHVIARGYTGHSGLVAEPSAQRCGRRTGGLGAEDSTGETASGTEEFVRLSADPNDKRVDLERKRLIPGTYTTTLADYRLCVGCPDDPVDRYALPNPNAITTAFHLRPVLGDGLQRGLVQPNFGHDGGGAEAFFKSGTSDGSLIGIKPYGQ